MSGPPVLWHFPISHYNEKARWALDWKRIPHVRRALAMSYVPRALWATRQAKLPILVLDGQAIADSTRIIETLERLQPDPPLYPRDDAERRREYTAIGDAVNVAARIERLTKLHAVGILVSEETRRRVGHAIRFSPAPPTPVPGKAEPLRTYVPVSDGAEPDAYPSPQKLKAP